MIIFVNPKAAGGKALTRWHRLAPAMRQRYPLAEVHVCGARTDVSREIRTMVDHGHSLFVAAGGDGSVNDLLNAVMSLPRQTRRTLTIGAIGLGSSNDFHKPIQPSHLVSDIPCMVDSSFAQFRDIGVISFRTGGITVEKYFLINASVGLTAEANRLFNAPDRFLALLKSRSTPLAIIHAVVRTLFTYADKPLSLSLGGHGSIGIRLTNLAILKSPFVSGSIEFPVASQIDTGKFALYLAHDMRRLERLRLLAGLLSKSLIDSPKLMSWQAPFLSVESVEPFAVEFDGEVVQTTQATFSLLPKHLQVCTC
jgi:diacylglycerol kinase (ATP)